MTQDEVGPKTTVEITMAEDVRKGMLELMAAFNAIHSWFACGRCNVLTGMWSVPNSLWGEVMQITPDEDGNLGGGRICWRCFVEIAHSRGVAVPACPNVTGG